MTSKRKDIKAILADPALCKELVDGATDFICKVEGIRPSFVTETGQAAFNACRENGLTAALLAISSAWAKEIKGQPRTEFIGGITNCIHALNEIAFDIEQAAKHTSEEN